MLTVMTAARSDVAELDRLARQHLTALLERFPPDGRSPSTVDDAALLTAWREAAVAAQWPDSGDAHHDLGLLLVGLVACGVARSDEPLIQQATAIFTDGFGYLIEDHRWRDVRTFCAVVFAGGGVATGLPGQRPPIAPVRPTGVTADDLATDQDPHVRIVAAHARGITPEALAVLAEDDNEYVAGAVAGSVRTPPELLRRLALHHAPFVRAALAVNSKASEAIVTALSADDEAHVRMQALLSGRLKPELADRLRRDAAVADLLETFGHGDRDFGSHTRTMRARVEREAGA